MYKPVSLWCFIKAALEVQQILKGGEKKALSIGTLGLKEPHGKIGNPEIPMDKDTTSLSKSLSSLAEGNRKVMSGPLSKDIKL